MKTIGIVGFGRFGQLLAELARGTFDVVVVETDSAKQIVADEQGFDVVELDELVNVEYIFLAVPISHFQETVKSLKRIITEEQVIIDLCSVKVYPTDIMKEHLSKAQLLGAHPLFGPDSASTGLEGLQVALCPISINEHNLRIISNFWKSHGLEIIVTTPSEHDRDTVYSQAFTYSIARIINNMKLPEITFTTKSYKAITTVATLSAKDSEQLFHDMMFYNPYFSHMKRQLSKSSRETLTTLDEIEAEKPEFNVHQG